MRGGLKFWKKVEKMIYPGPKSLWRFNDSDGNFFHVGILI